MPPCAFTDETRAVLRITGADARPLLQDLVTNDLTNVGPDQLVYAALLTPQGKYLFDFFVAGDGDAFLVDVAANRAPALAQRLSMYRLRRDMEIAATDLTVSLCWGGEVPPNGQAPRDPRHEALGWRLYGAKIAPTADRCAYDALRVAHMIPETGAELIPDETYILEVGFERLNGVDFRKGCYVGQEVTARMKHKTVLKKGLTRVAIEGMATPGDDITADGKPAGKLHSIAGNQALAHVRFDRATGEMTAGEATLRRIE